MKSDSALSQSDQAEPDPVVTSKYLITGFSIKVINRLLLSTSIFISEK